MVRPNFFIVGASKAGTSLLWHYLKEHPQIFMPKDELYKEPAFFSDNNQQKVLDHYLMLFKDATEQQFVVGEASTAYLTDPKSAQRIYNFNPESQIIIILRNPTDRAYSLYNWMVQEGYEYAASFKKALELEKKRKLKKIPNYWEPAYYWNYMYFSSGLYCSQVKRYLDLFGDNVLVLKFDDLVDDLNKTYHQVCTFLGVKTTTIKPLIINPSRGVLLPVLQFILRKFNHRFYRIRRLLLKTTFSKSERDLLLRLGQLNRPPRKLSPLLRQKLISKYLEDLKKLSNLTKLDFSGWSNT